ncbi:hypothetical protein ACFFGT_00635 [Mucilaginibacter angelicae]|uniref:Lipoprotein n=1 Tax=Mucilaginibacter angelicae TaxID=869718 RepID=A0ABV6KZ56_9SPHI
MKPIRKTIAISTGLFLLALFFVLCNCSSIYAMRSHKLSADSNLRVEKVREVLLSQQLFVVKLSKVKSPKKTSSKKVNVNFKAELRDAFMITRYDNGKSNTELSWTMCPNGVCPVPGTYKIGTPEYKQLDLVIARAKQANAKSQKELNALRAGER